MLPVDRKAKIKDMVLEKKSVIVSDLASLFGVTEETIRRDLKQLEEEGVLQRTYGGAFVQDGVQNDISVKIRETIYIDSKKAIAQKAKPLIKNGDSIFLDHSTTALFLAHELVEMRITVVTNSLKITNLLSEYENIKLFTIGGRYIKQNEAFFGMSAIKALSQFTVDKAFISCRSLSIQSGINDAIEELAQLRQSVLTHSNETYLIADYSKLDKSSFVNICRLDEINAIITDRPLNENWKNALKQYGVIYYD